MNKVLEGFVSPTAAGQIVGVTRQEIHRQIRTGRIPAQKIGNQYVIPMSVLKKLFHRCPKCGQVDAK